jgi:hypothetical protein
MFIQSNCIVEHNYLVPGQWIRTAFALVGCESVEVERLRLRAAAMVESELQQSQSRVTHLFPFNPSRTSVVV